ncbi:FG-GAP repeat domain-containing protein, partial [Actinomycetota bacterium Odt1-20B]
TTPCLADTTTLLGDLDGDGHPDKITNPGLTGTKVTIQWGNPDGTYGTKQSLNTLVGTKTGEVTTAAVADFHKDGVLDLVVNTVKPAGGDDPNSARISDIRPSPLKRTHLTSPHAHHLDIGDNRETKQLRIANYGNDPYPDLAILDNAGDGVWERNVRVSEGNTGPGNYNQDDY